MDRKDKEAEPCHESHSRCVDEPPSEADVGIEARKTDEADARIRDMPPCEGSSNFSVAHLLYFREIIHMIVADNLVSFYVLKSAH